MGIMLNEFTYFFHIFIDELEISKEDHYRALSISKDEDLELHLKNNLIPTLLINILILV